MMPGKSMNLFAIVFSSVQMQIIPTLTGYC